MKSETSRFNKKVAIIICIATIFTIACSAFVYTAYNNVRSINENWVRQNEQSFHKVRLVSSISRHLGYGGFIHNFKNYVLRQDDNYKYAAHRDLLEVERALLELQAIHRSENDQASIAVIKKTIEEYLNSLNAVSEQVWAGTDSVRLLDQIAKVSDDAAIQAMQTLLKNIFTENHNAETATSLAIENTLSLVLMGLFALPVIGVAAWVSVALINRLVAAQSAIQREQRRLELLIENIDKGISLIGHDMKYVVMNTKFNKLAGYPEDLSHVGAAYEATVRFDAERGLYGEGDTEALFKKRLSELADPNPSQLQIEMPDGAIVESRIHPISGGGFVSSFIDITQHVKSEEELARAKAEAEEASKAKSQFLANMSHEIRTPMNAIIGLSHMALKGNPDSKARDYLTKIHSSAQSLLGIINDILDFSKIEAGRLSIEEVPFQLDEVLQNVATLVGGTATAKGLEVIFWTDADVPRFLNGDPLRFGQIMTNLLSNAVKFTEKGEINVRIRCAERSDHSVLLAVSVTDTGIGLSQEQIGRLFKAFSQADGSTTRKFGGTGLGLSICKRLVELMGGNISVSSTPDIGSSFQFTVSLGIRSGDIFQSMSADFNPAELRVLIIDDSSTAQSILLNTFDSLGISQVDSVTDGLSALKMISADIPSGKTYDLLLIDWRMMGMDGLDTFRAIESVCEPEFMPAVFLITAHSREAVMSQAKELKIDAFLTKPLSTSILMETIVNHFAGPDHSYRLQTGDIQSVSGTNEKLAGLRVLLTEDNEINQQVARELLEDEGVIVDIAANGRIAVNKLKETPDAYDLILMDLHMPEMDGYEATAAILAQPEVSGVPIIAMTAHALVEERDRCLATGMVDHIAKPIEPILLFRTLVRHAPDRPNLGIAPDSSVSRATVEVGASSTSPQSVPEKDAMPANAGFNLNEIQKKIGLKKEPFYKLITEFVETYGDLPAKISAAVKREDREELARLAHTVSGLAGTFGCENLQEQAKAFEIACADSGNGSIPDPSLLIAAHNEDFARLTVALDDHNDTEPDQSRQQHI